MASYPHRLLVVTSALSQVKSQYPHAGVHPNRITQSLVAILAGLQLPFLCTETHELGEELVASISIKSICTTGWKSTATAGSSPTMISDHDFERRSSDLRRIHVFSESDKVFAQHNGFPAPGAKSCH
jgi:hypothetical protein